MSNVEKLKSAREKLGWNQQRMADAIGIDRSYLSQLENEQREIQQWIVEKAEQLCVDNLTLREQSSEFMSRLPKGNVEFSARVVPDKVLEHSLVEFAKGLPNALPEQREMVLANIKLFTDELLRRVQEKAAVSYSTKARVKGVADRIVKEEIDKKRSRE